MFVSLNDEVIAIIKVFLFGALNSHMSFSRMGTFSCL